MKINFRLFPKHTATCSLLISIIVSHISHIHTKFIQKSTFDWSQLGIEFNKKNATNDLSTAMFSIHLFPLGYWNT